MKKSIQMGKFRLFAGMKAEAVWASLALLFVLGFSACPMADDGGGGDSIDKTQLEASIAAAEAARDGVAKASSADTVPLGTKWVTQDEWNTFDTAITAANDARTNATKQANINSAKTALDNALDTFNNTKKNGTAAPINTSALTAKIAGAEAARASVQQAASASAVAQGAKWVTAGEWNTFDTAITSAKNALTSTSQSTVDTAVTALANAITAFNNAKQNGSKTTGFSTAELTALIAQANAAKEGVKVSDNGNDVSPAEYWARQSDISTLTTAISSAQAANVRTRDSLYLALVQALTTFNEAKQTGTVPNKQNLFNAIEAADTAKQGVVEAASKAQAPQGSKWATAAQFAPLNTAYSSAIAALNGSATQNAVDTATSALSTATSTFSSAVSGNGLGEKSNSLTITGLPTADFPNGSSLQFGLSTTAAFEMDAPPPVYGQAEVSNGQVQVQLYSTSTMAPWTGSGSWYAGFMLEDGRLFISKAAIDFTANAAPTKAFSDFKPYAYSVKLGDFANYFFDEGTPSVTLNAYFHAIMYANYTEWLAEAGTGYTLYKNEAMTQAYSGSETVTAETVVYCAYPIERPPREKIGEITGTITFTNVPAQKPRVSTNAFDVNWGTGSAEISLSGISGGSGTVNWTIPVYEDSAFTGTIQASFSLYVDYGAKGSYFIITGTKQLNGTTADVGSLGTFSLAAVTLSGTINVTCEGNTVPRVDIQACNSQGYPYGSALLRNPAAGAAWSITIPAFTSPTTVYLKVTGWDGSNWQSSLFENPQAATVNSVYNTNKTGIDINLGNSSGFSPPCTRLNANTWEDGNIAAQGGAQWFKFTATAFTQYIHFKPGTLPSVFVDLYDSRGNVVGSQSYLSTDRRSTSRSLTHAQVYYIKVSPDYYSGHENDAAFSDSGGYQIAFSTAIVPPGLSATPLTAANTWADGNIPTEDGEQWFRFNATAATQYIHASFGTLTSLSVTLYNDMGNETDRFSLNSFFGTGSSTVIYNWVYYIKVTPYSGSGTYRIAFNTSYDPPADG
jgi:hypothetical protein